MAWTTPALLTTGYRVRENDWNTQVAGNMLALDQHRHTGSPGDGAALSVPRPIEHQALVANTTALINIYTDIFSANPFGANGNYHVLLHLLFHNASGGNRTISAVGNYGGTTATVTSGTLATSALRRMTTVRFWLANVGATNTQALTGDMLADGAAGGTVFTGSAFPVIDSSVAGTSFSLGLQMSGAANVALDFEVLYGYIVGPSFHV